MGDQLDVFVINKFHANFFIGPMSALKVFFIRNPGYDKNWMQKDTSALKERDQIRA